MTYNPVGWFEIPVNDMARATKFYEDLFDFKMIRQDMADYEMTWFPMEHGDMKGASGALMKGMGYEVTGGGTIIYFTCPDIDTTVAKAELMGSKVVLPKKDIGEYGTIAWITDSEGNIIALHTAKK